MTPERSRDQLDIGTAAASLRGWTAVPRLYSAESSTSEWSVSGG